MSTSGNSNFGRWLLALLVAAIAVAVIYYIGWFDNRTHVDSPNGDNVEENYDLANPESAAEVEWQNADGQSIDQVITEPEAETATPPTGE